MVGKLKRLALAAIACAALVGAWPSSGLFPNQVTPVPGNFYWAASGSDAANCLTPVTPCQTMAHFNSFSFPASPVPVVHFNGGDTFTGGMVIPTNNITITSYGNGRPIFSPGNTTRCIYALNRAGLTINNIDCEAIAGTSTKAGIYLEVNTNAGINLAGPTITNNIVNGFGGACVGLVNSTGIDGYNNVTINNNSLHDCTSVASTGESLQCLFLFDTVATSPASFTNVTISGNSIFNCKGNVLLTTNGSGFGILVFNTTNFLIQNNSVHDNGQNNGFAGAGPVGIITGPGGAAANGTIQFNEVYNQSAGGLTDGEGINVLGNGITVQYNYLHHNSTAEILVGQPQSNGITVRFNLIQTDNGGEIGLWALDSIRNVFLYNNTVVDTSGGPCYKVTPTAIYSTLLVANNICFANSGSSSAIFDVTAGTAGTQNLDGNIYTLSGGGTFDVAINGTHYTTLAALHTATGLETHGLTSNPNLTGTFPAGNCSGGGLNSTCPAAYKLTSTSPAGGGHGLNLNSLFGLNVGTQDFYGIALNCNSMSIGAHALGSVPSGTCPGGGAGNIALVQQNIGTSGAGVTSKAVTLTGTTVGNFIAVGIGWCLAGNCASGGAAPTISTVTSSAGETCHQALGAHGNSSGQTLTDIWFCNNIHGGSDTVTVTASGTVDFLDVGLSEWSGVQTTTAVDDFIGNRTQGVGTALTASTNGTTSQNGELIYSISFIACACALTTPQLTINSINGGAYDEYQKSNTANSAFTNSATSATSNNWSMSVAGFLHP